MSYMIIHTDVIRTRRSTLNHVFNEHDQLVYSSPSLENCIRWCHDLGHTRVVVAGQDHLTHLQIREVIDADKIEDAGASRTAAVLKWLGRHA